MAPRSSDDWICRLCANHKDAGYENRGVRTACHKCGGDKGGCFKEAVKPKEPSVRPWRSPKESADQLAFSELRRKNAELEKKLRDFASTGAGAGGGGELKDGDSDNKALAIVDCGRIFELRVKTYGADSPATVAAKQAPDDARKRRDESKPMAVQLSNAERKAKARGQAVEAAKEKIEQTRKRLQEEEAALASRVTEKETADKEVAELAAKVAAGGGGAAGAISGDSAL